MAERVAATLRQQIASGEWEIGAQLPAEHQLMERFGISRPSCREALRILQSEGLVRILRGNKGGAQVTLPDPSRIAGYANVYLQMRQATISEVFETRMVIEPAAIALIARNPDRELLSLLAQNAASQHYLLHDRPAFYRKGRDFRQLFLDHCGSESLRLTGLMIGEIADSQLSLLSVELPYMEGQEIRFKQAIHIKEQVIGAMGRREETEAADLWRSYLHFYLDNLHIITPPTMRNLKPFPLD